jgi:hypothetical protein
VLLVAGIPGRVRGLALRQGAPSPCRDRWRQGALNALIASTDTMALFLSVLLALPVLLFAGIAFCHKWISRASVAAGVFVVGWIYAATPGFHGHGDSGVVGALDVYPAGMICVVLADIGLGLLVRSSRAKHAAEVTAQPELPKASLEKPSRPRPPKPVP